MDARSNIVCVVCAEKVKEDCVGYDEESYRVGSVHRTSVRIL